jgi:hypothetical protein
MDNYRNLRHNKTDQSFIQKIFTNKKIIVYDMYNSSYHDFYLYVVPLTIVYDMYNSSYHDFYLYVVPLTIVYDMYNSSYHDFYLYVVPLIIQYLH